MPFDGHTYTTHTDTHTIHVGLQLQLQPWFPSVGSRAGHLWDSVQESPRSKVLVLWWQACPHLAEAVPSVKALSRATQENTLLHSRELQQQNSQQHLHLEKIKIITLSHSMHQANFCISYTHKGHLFGWNSHYCCSVCEMESAPRHSRGFVCK